MVKIWKQKSTINNLISFSKLLLSKNIGQLNWQEGQNSRVYKFVQLQLQNPIRGHWGSSCAEDLRDLEVNLSFGEIQNLDSRQFTKMFGKAMKVKAFEYLTNKHGPKGQEIEYTEHTIAEYLMPNLKMSQLVIIEKYLKSVIGCCQ